VARRQKPDDTRGREPAPVVTRWLSDIESCKRREKEWVKEGRKIREIYAGRKRDETPFNILHSNTAILRPSLYSALPRPHVQRRFKDDDVLGKAAGQAAQKYLEFSLDTNLEGHETFDDAAKAAVLDGLLPGRGITTVVYDYEPDDDDDKPGVKWEHVFCESQSWDRYTYGYARKWNKVPWVAFELHMSQEDAEEKFGKDVAKKIEFTEGDDAQENDKGIPDRDQRNTGSTKTALIYQIWDKEGGRKVCYISAAYPDGYLLEEEDPYGLSGFFPVPKPLEFIEHTDDLVPVSMYSIYQNQARELNRLTYRITKIVECVKARGLYDSELGGELSNLFDGEDNALIPTEKGSSLAADKGLDKAIWFMPLETLIQTLRELYAAREQCKQVIYEITGISDIVRGASKASETLGAQQIKSQWGTLRIKPNQQEVQRYVRDLLRMMVEIAANKFSEETWVKMTGLPFATEQQMQQATMVAQAKAQQGDMSGMQQLQGIITWKQVLDVLKDDIQRAYKIDIETNSTLEPEAVEDKQDVTEFMTAMGQFMSGVGPAIQEGMMPFQAAQAMLLAITRRFRFGDEVEEIIKGMQQPPPKPDDGKAAADAAKQQVASQSAQLQAQQQMMQKDGQITQLQTQLTALQKESALSQRSTDLDVRELALKMEQEAFKTEKQAAAESIQTRTALAAKDLESKGKDVEHKKQLTTIAGQQVKADQNVGKTVDSKMAQAVEKQSQMIAQLVEAIAAQAKETQGLVAAVNTPKRRKAIRGPDGNITETVEEPVSQGTVQ